MELTDVIALLALVAMEIVLGIDNIVFISVVTSRLPESQQRQARNIGLFLAMFLRIGLLLTITWILALKSPAFSLTSLGVPGGWLGADEHVFREINEVSWKDIILLLGGLFLIRSSVKEIHHKVEGLHEEGVKPVVASFGSVIGQILMLDVIFSLDSVITAVGMVKQIWVMIVAVVIAVAVMMAFAGYVARFVERHPTVKMLALSFLLLIGVMLVAEGSARTLIRATSILRWPFRWASRFSICEPAPKRRGAGRRKRRRRRSQIIDRLAC